MISFIKIASTHSRDKWGNISQNGLFDDNVVSRDLDLLISESNKFSFVSSCTEDANLVAKLPTSGLYDNIVLTNLQCMYHGRTQGQPENIMPECLNGGGMKSAVLSITVVFTVRSTDRIMSRIIAPKNYIIVNKVPVDIT